MTETTPIALGPDDFGYWLACAREIVARDDLEAVIVLAADAEGKLNLALATPADRDGSRLVWEQLRELAR